MHDRGVLSLMLVSDIAFSLLYQDPAFAAWHVLCPYPSSFAYLVAYSLMALCYASRR